MELLVELAPLLETWLNSLEGNQQVKIDLTVASPYVNQPF